MKWDCKLYRVQESPASKLLFAKDVPEYRKLVGNFYNNIRERPEISDDEMHEFMIEMSKVCKLALCWTHNVW